MAHALNVYLEAVGMNALAWYPDDEGDWSKLDAPRWEALRSELLAPDSPGAHVFKMCERPDAAPSYEVEYCGKDREDLLLGAVCALSFWLPTEYMEEHGPEKVRALALELAGPLPFCSAHAGLAFKHIGTPKELRTLRLRYPGMDDCDLMRVSWTLGTRVRGPSWMNFLGPPVLHELGGAQGLRSHLSSPGINVQELPGERALITLGPWPDAGDTEQGRDLPHYRELARVLEPWLYHEPSLQDPVASEETRRWERRFLD
ncbi:DUF3396 domain-containing protein [Cystobacter ferrugineus]|uniref:DUF3396 domain-containing protein n=1 Tax=Cystobacter ferrugineus TaxID=83449 RepID=UPI001FE9BB10|nr:DUF3396 domain-containing protein [Cystobacter ferrugineus]